MLQTFDNNDWQLDKSVLERNKYMFQNRLATDVSFMVGNEDLGTTDSKEKIEAHKYVLISASPVFWAMFTGQFKEPSLQDVLPDVEPESFKEMLRFIYYEDINITGGNVMQILYLSKKYMIPRLTKICTEFLEENLSIENVCTIFEQCILFEENEVIVKCKDVIQANASEIFQTESFRNISKDTLLKIVEMEKLFIEEIELFEVCIKWVLPDFNAKSIVPMNEQSRDNVRLQLGGAFFKIRFTQMSLTEFANIVVPSGILTMEEENLCFRYFTQNTKPINVPFPTSPRLGRDSRFIWLAPVTEYEVSDAEIWTKTNIGLHFTNLSNKSLTFAGFNGIKNSNVSGLYFRVSKLSHEFSSVTSWTKLSTMKYRDKDNSELEDYIIFATEQTLQVAPLTRIEFSLQLFGKLTILNQQSCKFEKGNASINVVSDLLYIPISGVLCRKEPQ